MPPNEKPQPMCVPLKRGVIALFVLLFLYIGVVFAIQPVLTFFPQLLEEEITAKELLAYRIVGFVLCLPVGCLSFWAAIHMVKKSVRGYSIISDDRGVILDVDLISYGMIAWQDVWSMTYYGRPHKKLLIVFRRDEFLSGSMSRYCRIRTKWRRKESEGWLFPFPSARGIPMI